MKRSIVIIVLLATILYASIALYKDRIISDINIDDLQEKGPRIALIVKMKYGDYWKTVLKGAEAAAKEFGVELVFDAPLEEDDISGQIDIFQYYIDEGYEGIVLAASDYSLLDDKVEEALNSGIPVTLIDSRVKSNSYYRSYSTDNYDAGKKAGEQVIKLAGTESTVAIVSFVPGSENAMQRERGIRDYLENYKDITVLDTRYCMSSIDLATTITEDILSKHGEVDVIVGLNAIATTGVAREVSKEKSVVVIGFDSTQEEISYLDKGIIDATIVQNPFGMGYLGVKAAYEATQGKRVSEYDVKDISIDTKVITPDNMFLPENQKLVFPFNE